MKHKEITDKIIRSFYDVYNHFGYGFAEKVYKNAMMIELERKGLKAEKERKVEVFYVEELIGTFFADITVENRVILELKACEKIIEKHRAQLLNYLKASNIEIGLLLNFGPDPKFNRVISSNRKENTSPASST